MELTEKERSELWRLIYLALFWLPYIMIPFLTGWTYSSNIECTSCWSDLLRFSFSIFGYGTIGCLFYAVTGRNSSDSIFRGKLRDALIINSSLFVVSIQLNADWDLLF